MVEPVPCFTAAYLAGLPGMPKNKRNVLIMAQRENWAFSLIRSNGGPCRAFLFTSLPSITQDAILRYASPDRLGPVHPTGPFQTGSAHDRLDSSALAPSSPPKSPGPALEASYINESQEVPLYKEYDHEALQSWFARRTDAQRGIAIERLKAVNWVIEMVGGGMRKGKAFARTAKDCGCSANTLRGWYKRVQGYHRDDRCAALCPRYVGCTVRAEFSPAAVEFLKATWLRVEKPSFSACYRLLRRTAQAENWVIPCQSAAKKRLFREVPREVRIFKREGYQGAMKIYPAQERTVRASHALDRINADGYEHNVFVKWPDGTIARPKTWFVQDAYSRKFLAWRTDTTEHTDLIRLATGDCIEKYGIPNHCHLDNTRAAANKWMTGGVPNRYRFKVKHDDPLGLFPMLGIEVHFTSVNFGHGHGQAKPVERAFGIGGIGEVVDKHPALAGAWTGNSPAAKPENYASRAAPYAEFVRVLNDGVAALNAQPNRRTEMGAGKRSADEVFDESYKKSVIRKATAEQRAHWLLAAEAIFIRSNGTFTLNAGGAPGLGRNRYCSPVLYDHVGTKCVVRFDPDDLHADTHIYSLDGTYITAAACVDPVGFGDTQSAREYNRKRNQSIRATRDRASALVSMDAIEAAKLIPPMPNAEPAEATVIRMARPIRTLFEHRAPKPRPISAEESERMREWTARMEAEEAAEAESRRWPYFGTLTSLEQYDYWQEIARRMQAGEDVPEHARSFYEHFQGSPEYQSGKQEQLDRGLGTEDELAAERERRRWPEAWTFDNAGKYEYWHEVDRRLQAGEEAPENVRRFFEAFPKTRTFRTYQEVDRDLGPLREGIS